MFDLVGWIEERNPTSKTHWGVICLLGYASLTQPTFYFRLRHKARRHCLLATHGLGASIHERLWHADILCRTRLRKLQFLNHLIPHHKFLRLARRGERQFRHKTNDARNFVMGDLALAVTLNFFRARRFAGL